jgi:hypothetical protein
MSIMPIESSASPTEHILVERMVFGWWNTSLSPVGRDRADDKHKTIAGNIIKWLINDLNVDCLALGEVTADDLKFLREYSDNKSFVSYDGTLKEGKLQFDTGVIYDLERLSIANKKSVTSTHAGRNLKVANRIDFVSASDAALFHIFVSHWPSRGQDENILSRETVAERLNDQVKEIYEQSANASIILLGDYNDDPFDKSLSWHLPATRDRHLAVKKRLFYNPFWRQLGESEPHTFSNTKRSAGGSYFYRSGTITRWHTFDQILFSSAFLGGSKWHLNEEDTMILRTEYLIELVQNSAVFF